jgi:hypothetical protein
MIYSAFLKYGGTPISFHEDNISLEEKKGKKSRIVINNPTNTSEENNRAVPAKVYLHEVEIKPEHKAEIIGRFRPKPKKQTEKLRRQRS